MRRCAFVFVLPVVALVAGGCGASPKGLQSEVRRSDLTGDQKDRYAQLVGEGDAAWESRADRNQLELAIQKWDEAVQLKDDDYKTYGKLTRATYLLADGWLSFEEDKKSEFLAMHQRGLEYAERGLAAVSADFEKRRRAGTNIEDAIRVIDRRGVELMYWYASNLGKWAKAKDFATVLKQKDRIFNIISRVYELAPEFFYGAADRYFGAFYSVAPTFAGGDLQKSYDHFQASLKRAPNYVATYVLIAELYCPKAQDPDMFDEALNFVLDAPDDVIPELTPETLVEKKKAKRLMAQKDELF